MKRLAATLAVLAVVTFHASAQRPTSPVAQTPATFRAAVDLVEVTAVVTDRRGNLVTDLSAADFDIREDRRPQTIEAFARVTRAAVVPDPLSVTAAPVRSDVQSNVDADGVAYGVVLDGLHIGRERAAAVAKATRAFLERGLSPTDLAAVVLTGSSNTSALDQQFTTERAPLLDVLQRFTGTAMADAPAAARRTNNADPQDPFFASPSDPADRDRAARAEASLQTLRNLGEALAGARGRRSVIVFVSEGIEYDDSDITSGRTAQVVRDGLRAVLDAAARANVAIYTIDPRGLEGTGGRGAFGPAVAAAQQTLRDLAEGTGGRAAVSAAEVAAAFERLVDDSQGYYALGYASEQRDGRAHRIEVRVKRPGLRVLARRGRVAAMNPTPASNETSATLADAMASPLPLTAMPLRAFAVPFRDAGPNAAVLLCLEWPGGDGNFALRSGSSPNTLELDISAYDDQGRRTGGTRHTITTAFEPESLDAIRTRGLRLLSQLELPPGRHHLRIAAAEANGRAAGSVMYDLEIPNLADAAFATSGISTFAWPERPAQLTTGSPAPLSSVLPWPPTLDRRFHPQDEIALFLEVYDASPRTSDHALAVRATLESLEGRVLVEDHVDWSSADARGHRNEYGIQAKLPLRGIPQGVYVVRVQATSEAPGAPTLPATLIPIVVSD